MMEQSDKIRELENQLYECQQAMEYVLCRLEFLDIGAHLTQNMIDELRRVLKKQARIG